MEIEGSKINRIVPVILRIQSEEFEPEVFFEVVIKEL